MKTCPQCGYHFSTYQQLAYDYDHRCTISDAIEIANSEQENNSPLGSCLWYLRVCELVEYEP